jgi:hypothetical protein
MTAETALNAEQIVVGDAWAFAMRRASELTARRSLCFDSDDLPDWFAFGGSPLGEEFPKLFLRA